MMNIIRNIALSLVLILSTGLANASENLLWLGYNKNSSDFFVDVDSQIKPDGLNAGFSTEIFKNTALTISYSNFEGETSSTLFENNNMRLVNSGKVKSTSLGLSLSWLFDDYGLTLAYGQLDNTERSLTRLPLIIEAIEGDDQILSFSYDKFIIKNNWQFGWSVGSQYAQSDVLVQDLIGSNPVTLINAQFDNKSWSIFSDIQLGYGFQNKNLVITPKLSLSWNWEISNSGNEVVIVARDGMRRTFTQLNDRQVTTFRTPDSGFWETGLDFVWDNGWGASIVYGQNIAAEQDLDSIAVDISLSF